MNHFLIIITVTLFILQTLSLKLVRARNLSDRLLANCLSAFLAAFSMGLITVFIPAFKISSPATLVCGILFGIAFALTVLFYLSAISCGPLSYTSFYLSASMLLPAGSGILFFQEKPSLPLLFSLILFLAAFYLLNVNKDSKKTGPRWMFFCLLTFLGNGSSGIIQKTHQYLTNGADAAGLMTTGFATASFCYALAFLFTPNRAKPSAVIRQNLLPICLLAVSSLGGNLLLTHLSAANAGSYLFPLVQGSIIPGVTLCSLLFFKEKLTVRGLLGILAGTAGIVIINM